MQVWRRAVFLAFPKGAASGPSALIVLCRHLGVVTANRNFNVNLLPPTTQGQL